MIHIVDNIYLDSDQYCFILQEKYITPDKSPSGTPNKNAGQVNYINQSYHATHMDVMNKIMDKALKKALDNDYVGFMELIEGTKKQFKEILKVKR